jgi:hypothetical protein
MKKLLSRWLQLSFILLAVLSVLLPASVVNAETPTTSIHIIKYAANGKSIMGETNITIAEMQTLAVQGDGITHYYTQGPTQLPDNLWDPEETFPGDTLKDKGALKGTALSDLCNLVGGADEGDGINVRSIDGRNETFQYANVYNQLTEDLNQRQGKMVICWYKDGKFSGPTWDSGMLLAFFPEVLTNGKYIFSNQDMHDCLPEQNWHYFTGYDINYPSINGAYNKNVTTITIYSSGEDDWEVALSGAFEDTLTQTWFENGIACHDTFTFNGDSGNVWSGLPLWYVIGMVDDDNLHGPGAFNQILANAGYDVRVVGEDGSYTFDSKDICRNDNYLLANKINGDELGDEYYPLKLVGAGLTDAAQSIGKIDRIELLNIPDIELWELDVVKGNFKYIVSQAFYELALTCHGPDGQPWTYNDGTNTWSGMPLWYFCGLVDDNDQHGSGSYNDDLAMAGNGYSIKVIGSAGEFTVLNSKDISRSSHYLIANMKNGEALTGAQYPLVLVGSGVSTDKQVLAVSRIEVAFSPAWDLNCDHVCNVGDIAMIGKQWGKSGTAGWIPEDLNKDGAINICDVVVLGWNWNETW